MAIFLGVDTGGTYTDAAVYDDERRLVLGKAKALTTPRDLAEGVGAAAAAALAAASRRPDEISFASLSTTLATNALVEGHGDPAALVLIGFREADLARAGLAEALGRDPAIIVTGGHDNSGGAVAPLDLEALEAAVSDAAPHVSAFAVAGLFAVRNAAHEIAARDLIATRTGLPVTCSHELSARLGGPKRALTTLLNGRLIGMIQRLIDGAADRLAALGVEAPLMVVKGDGALMTADMARARPIETILSGPAASVVGAAHLTGCDAAVVSDIGGTTTDIAVIADGRPRIDPEGAEVGGWRTMVRAAAMRTHGLGGDSEVRIVSDDGPDRLTLGPRRATPVSLFAASGGAAHAALDRQLDTARPGDFDGEFVLRGAHPAAGLDPRTAALLEKVSEGGAPVDELVSNRRDQTALQGLIRAGALRRVAFTPTDAAHVAGLHDGFDAEAARKAATLFARRRRRDGTLIAADGAALSDSVIALLQRRSAELILNMAFEADGVAGAGLAESPLAQTALSRAGGLADIRIALTAPLIGLGASAPTYYPAIAELLRTEGVVPDHADVANAVGAVVGRVAAEAAAVISSPALDQFLITTGEAPVVRVDEGEAVRFAEDWVMRIAADRASAAGAAAPEVSVERVEKRATIEGVDRLIELALTARAMGRPGF